MTPPFLYRWGPAIAGLVLLVALTATLQGLITFGAISPFVVPPPTAIAAAIPELFLEENLVGLFAVTLSITFAATAMAVLFGLPAGYLLYRYRTFGEAYESWLGAIFSAPIILLYPLFLVVMGRGILTIVVMSFVVGVTPIILSTYTGLRSVPEVYVKVARSFNMPEHGIFRKVLLPAALPQVLTGIRLALIYTMINAVAMEFLISMGGLGYLVGDLYDRYDLPEMYAAVFFVVLASVLFFTAINRVEAWLKQ